MSEPLKRMTRQKVQVRDSLERQPGFASAQGLHAALMSSGATIGLATVYRALNELAAAGLADTLQSPSGETLFRGCSTTGHHHHLICRECGLTVEVHSEIVEEWAHKAAAENGFTAVGHVLDIFGLCGTCADSRSSR
jgi:Fur family ferric uptake transcriptional regulator